MSNPYPWIKDSQYGTTPSVTGYLEVTSTNGLYLNSKNILVTNGQVTATTFNGALNGNATTATTATTATNTTNATNATNVTIADEITNDTFYPVFVSNNTGNLPLKVDKTTNPLSYNPSSGTFTATTFVGALTGNATTATRATNIAGGSGAQIPYQSGINTTSFLANGTGGQVLQSNGGAAAPSWSSRSTFTEQLTLPTTRPTATFSGGILTCSFDSKSTGIFIATLTADMTGISFTNGRIGGQYVIYISANGGTRTIAATLTPTATTKTNYTSAINVLMSSVALLTITFDGTNYLIAGSAFNSTQVQALTDAVFEYSPDGVSWFTIPSGGTGVTYDGNSYQFRVFSVSPSGATYSSYIPSPISQQGQTAQLSVTGTGSYTGTITSGIFTILQRTLLAYYAPGGASPVSADSCVVDGSVAEFNFSLENLVGFDAGVSVNIIYGTSYNQSSGEIRQPAPVASSGYIGYVNDQTGSGNNFIVTTTSNVAVYCNENENYRGQYWWIVINPYQWEDDTGFITNNPAYNNNYTSPIVSVSGSNAFFDNTCV